MSGAFITGVYPNVFENIGIDKATIDKRANDIFMTLFYGSDDERLYHPVEPDMGYMVDTGNNDARTEGMSYGMMMCVQTDHKEEFDRLWKWARTYMFLEKGPNAGYFCWSNALDGTKNSGGAAPDGEEFFAMALFFASHRWGDGEGIFDYSKEACELLHRMIHKGENGEKGCPMFDPDNHYIKFIAEVAFTDPSYHLPHFYELFGRWAYEEDREFFLAAAKASREYLKKACDVDTGLNPEYAEYDGTPYKKGKLRWGRHDWFYSDAYRTITNISLDGVWFDADAWEREEAKKYQKFFCETLGEDRWDHILLTDGTVLEDTVLHPTAVIATTAVASLINDDDNASFCVKKFWNTPLRTGERRYYDNCLYFFAFLALSGKYRIY